MRHALAALLPMLSLSSCVVETRTTLSAMEACRRLEAQGFVYDCAPDVPIGIGAASASDKATFALVRPLGRGIGQVLGFESDEAYSANERAFHAARDFAPYQVGNPEARVFVQLSVEASGPAWFALRCGVRDLTP